MIVTDDIDGSKDAETITFGLDGATYEIDLSAKNRAIWRMPMCLLLPSARKASPSRRRPCRHADGRHEGGARCGAGLGQGKRP